MLSLLVFLLLVLLRSTVATSTSYYGVYEVKETHTVPRGWRPVGPAPANQLLSLHICLKQEGANEIQRHLYEVSDPQHARYGQHLRLNEVHELSKPSDDAVSIVHGWLQENGIRNFSCSPAKHRINFSIRVDEAEKLLNTQYHIFEHNDGSRLIRTTNWSLPSQLHDLINVVQPTTSFMRSAPLQKISTSQPHTRALSKRQNNGGCQDIMTLACIKELYNIGDYTASSKNTKIGVVNFLGYYPVVSDIIQYLKENKDSMDPTATEWSSLTDYVTVNNGPTPVISLPLTPTAESDTEADFDAELIIGLTYPMEMRSWSTGGKASQSEFQPDLQYPDLSTNENEPWLEWLGEIINNENQTAEDRASIPRVISMSYADPENTIPKGMAIELCNDFAALGAMGISVLVASGDWGLGPENDTLAQPWDQLCIDPLYMNHTFIPTFPASCPWVTAVGATTWTPDLQETGADFPSGFGYSNYFKRPSYQNIDNVVCNYNDAIPADKIDKYQGWWNPDGRAYPDISAVGTDIAYVYNSMDTTLVGTSASTPIAASIVALINDALIQSGKPTMGFLNPWLYQNGGDLNTKKVFVDIKDPSKILADQGCGVDPPLFPVLKGWDVVTGWGSPNFGNWREYLMPSDKS